MRWKEALGVTLSPAHIRWLSLIRYQARVAEEQSALPAPLGTLAISGLQDAIEAMLGLVAEHHGIPVQRMSPFDKLFDAVTNRFDALEHYRGPLLALNSARVGYKHHGNHVDQSTVERHRLAAVTFLADTAQVCLAQDFHAVSLTGLINDLDARGLVESAETRWRAGEQHRALGDLRLAFDELIRNYENTTRRSGRSFFDARPHPSASYEAARARSRSQLGAFGNAQGKHFEDWLRNLENRMKMLAFGIDLRGFAFFDAQVPERYRIGPDGVTVDRLPGQSSEVPERVFRLCHRFVIDTALKLGADDFSAEQA